MDLNRLRILAGLDPIIEAVEPPADNEADDDEEEELGDLQESAPADEEEFVKKAKPDFKKRYGKRWKEVLYATAWKKHNKEANENLEVTADEIFAKLEENQADAKKLADQGEGDNPAKTGNHDSEFPKVKFLGDKGPANELTLTNVEFNDDKMEYNKVMTGTDVAEETKVKVPANVKAAITKRLKELKDSIDTYNEKGYSDEGAIYQDPKHTALEVLEKFKEHLDKGNLEHFKMAQVLYGTLDSPIFDLLPAQLVNFLHTGHEEKKKEI